MSVDYTSQMKVTRGISPAAAVTDNTAFVSQILDCANFDSNTFVGQLGALADADTTLAVTFEEGNDSGLSDAAAIATGDIVGSTSIGIQNDSDNKAFKIGYKGRKRYIRLTITPSNNTGNIFLSGTWVQMGCRSLPQTSQLV